MNRFAIARAKRNVALRRKRLAAARKKGRHSTEEWQALLEICGAACLRCGSADGKIVKDHIIPIYQDESSDGIGNLQPLCMRCNSAKGPENTDYRPSDWLEQHAARMRWAKRAQSGAAG